MTCISITLPKGDGKLLESLFLSEGRMKPAFPLSFEIKNGVTYRIWHIGEEDTQVEAFIPAGLEWSWTTEEVEEKKPFADF